jgi:CrcB protein
VGADGFFSLTECTLRKELLVRLPRLDARELAAIFVGGAAGSLLRVALSDHYPSAATSWPWIVFIINVTGAFILGYFVTRLQERLPLSTYRRPLVGTGFCGAFTTFSTVQLELVKMLEHHRIALAIGYAVASIAAGYLAIFFATVVTRRIRLRP